MKKILEIFGEPISHGGQEVFAMNIVNALDDNYCIDFFTPYYEDNKYFKAKLGKRGGHVYALGLKFSPGGFKFSVAKPMKQFLKKHPYDIIHINSGSTFFLAVACKVAKMSGAKKIIVHSHSSGERESIKHFLIKSLTGNIFRKYADDICATSYEAATWKFPQDIIDNKLIVIKNGINVARYKYNCITRLKIRHNLGIGEKTFVVGHVGRFSEEKNQVFIVRIFKEWLHINPDSKLVFVGDGEDISVVKKKVSDEELNDRVIFVGNVENVEDYFQAFDIFLFPSKYEGLGIAAIEAEASGLPIIASDKVPLSIAVTKNVKFIPLQASIDDWLLAMKDLSSINRTDNSDEIIKAGYGLDTLRNQIKQLYDNNT